MHIDTSGAAKSASFDADFAAHIAAEPAVAAQEARYAGRVIGLPARASSTAPA